MYREVTAIRLIGMNRFLILLTSTTSLVIATTLAVVASIVRILTGPGAAYSTIFPPPWLALIAAAMVVTVLVLDARQKYSVSRACTWISAIIFFGASGGFVLDAFRAFFAVTGLPAGEFAIFDVPGALSRGMSLLAALIVILHGQRVHSAAPVSSARRWTLRWIGAALALPYPLLKLVWWVQGESGPHDVGFPVGEILMFGAAVAWIVLLTRSRHSTVKSWMLVCGGLVGSGALLSMGALMVFGLAFQAVSASGVASFADGEATFMVIGVYSTWLGLGAVMLGATLTAMESTMEARSERRTVLA